MGGTKTLAGVGSSPDDLSDVLTIPTTTPEETLGRLTRHLRSFDLDAVGIASFGPVELRRDRIGYGSIGVTPKRAWSGVAVVGPVEEALGVPVGFDTDVNGAALGEHRWGAGRGIESLVYVTVGTGIGGGALAGGRPVHGLGHPEMGHISVRRDPGDTCLGVCPLHGDCLEGLASGPAIEARFGTTAESLNDADRGQAVRRLVLVVRGRVPVARGRRSLVDSPAPSRTRLVERHPGSDLRIRSPWT